MGKYLTEFSSNTAYNAALATLDYPNVSLVANELKYAESLPTMYRWVNDGDNTRCGGDDDGYDSCTLYQQTKKQKSVDGGQTWSDVVPAEYGYGDVIEEDSQECGCGEKPCKELDLADEIDDYNGQVVEGIQFAWVAVDEGTVSTIYIWDAFESECIGKVTCVVDSSDATLKTVYIYDGNDTLIDTINNYQEWSQWIRLCDYFEGRCMKLSTSSSDEYAYPHLGDNFIIKIENGEETCDCGCLDQ